MAGTRVKQKPWYSIRKAIIRAAAAAGIEQRVYAHLFRHSIITHGIEAGVEITALQQLARHSDIRTTRAYIHSRSRHLRREATKLAHYTGGAKMPQEANPPPETE